MTAAITARAPIFVMGTPRSGTTLLASMLGRHEQVLMPGELHFFEDIYARRAGIGDLADPAAREQAIERLMTLYGRFNQPDQARIDALFSSPGQRRRLTEAAGDYRALLATFMALQLEQAGKTRWGNNTPKDLFHVSDIVDLFPDAQCLICVRDVRDFMVSYKGRWQVSSHAGRLQALYHPVLTALLWRATARAVPRVLAGLGSGRAMLIHYETLVREPEQTLRAVCATLNLAFAPEMLRVGQHNSSHGGAGRSGIFTSSVGRWRTDLSAEEVYLAEWVAGRALESLGYERVRPKVSTARLAAHLGSLPFATGRALWANRAHRGPTWPYLRRRLDYLLR